MKKSVLCILITTFSLTACAKPNTEHTSATDTPIPSSAEINDPVLKQQVQQLLEKTKKELIFVKGGTYMMGDFGEVHSPDHLNYDSHKDSSPMHKVRVDDFSLSASKATYADLDVYTAATGQKKVGVFDQISIRRRIPEIAAGVNWQQARSYCQWLGQQIGRKMDLPTEAQWEYAARNRGKYILYPTNNGKIEDGKNIQNLEQMYDFSAKYKIVSRVAVLKQFPATAMGFYDLVNNNYEWMLDWYDPKYYSHSPVDNPKGPAKGTLRTVRSAVPADGENLAFVAGFTFSRKGIDPIADPKFIKSAVESGYLLDYNSENSVRCAANP
ncbi:formylglycine-generating enzyme family protein [Acinetobacter rudis]|uniref:formylglycine-generating enzyme family protein n=1 Tax=Acinetobacter rudis TaxID=632955 RepID=UPI003342D39F